MGYFMLKSQEKRRVSNENKQNSLWRCISYAGLAKILGITKTAISAKMHGKKNFTAEQVANLVEIFDKPAEYLMARDEN